MGDSVISLVKWRAMMLSFLFLTAGLGWAQQAKPIIGVTVDPAKRFQEIDGFGVNFNGPYFRDSAKPMVDMLIDDLGATIFRLDAYGFDLSNWEVVNDNDDPAVMNWDFYNDRYSMPNFEASWAAGRYINSKGGRVLLAAIGIAPEWMLDDKAPPPRHRVCSNKPKPCKLDHLNPAMYEEFAEQLVSMAIYARTRAHVDFQFFSPFNETDCYPAEGPRIDPDEMPGVLGAIARRLKKESLGDVRIVAVEQANVTTDYIGAVLEDAEVMRQIGAFSFHTYGEDSVGPQVDRVGRSGYPDMHVWLTEYGDLGDRDKSFENEWKQQALKASGRALRALNQGASAALFWDAFDNFENCELRPSFYGLMRNDNHSYSPKKRYFAAKQLYRFVRPGSVRVAAGTDSPQLMLSAFWDRSSASLIIVGVKEGGPNHVQIRIPESKLTPASLDVYQTTRTLDCRKTECVSVVKGTADFELPDESIFTLVGAAGKP